MTKGFIKLISGPGLLLICLLIGGVDDPQVRMLGVLLWMLAWWITSALPIGVTALLPIVLFPLLDILDLKQTTSNYANPIIYLFFGGFVLGLAIEKWGLHKRIALNIIKRSGERPNRIVLGSMLATALLSMWISNTATTVMMLPIGLSIAALLGDKLNDEKAGRNFGISLMLGIAYAANIGGITTLIGTPPNLVLAGISKESGLGELGFAEWMFFAFPLVILLFTVVYLVNGKLIFPVRIKKLDGVSAVINEQLKELGKMGSGEKRVMWIMISTACLWIFRSQITNIPGLEKLSDPIIAIAASIVLFAFPSGSKEKNSPILEWKDTRRLPWDILLLFGGGISLAKGMEKTNIVGMIGGWISEGGPQTPLLIILTVCCLAVFLTEVMSNVALVSVFVPVSFIIAQNLGLQELELAVPLTIGASCAFMFPISTPPNAIVYSSGYFKMGEMARTGIVLNLLCILLISVYCWFFNPFA